MRRFLGSVITALAVMLAVGAGVALAAELEITPADPGAGIGDLTIDVWDFDPDTPVYVVPCELPESGDPAEVTNQSCRIADMAATTTDATGAAIDVTWDLGEDGVAVRAADEMRDSTAVELIEIGDAGVAQEVSSDAAVLGTSLAQEDLAVTGLSSLTTLLAVSSIVLLAMGTTLRATAGRLAVAGVA